MSRGGRDVTGAFPELAVGLAGAAGGRAAILDGEVAALDGSRPSFALLQRRLHVSRPAWSLVAAVPVTYIVFDAGRLLTARSWVQRRVSWRICP